MAFGGFGGSNTMEVEIRGDGSDLASTLDGLDRGLLNLRTAVAGAGAALAALAAGGMAAAINAARDFEEQMIELEKVTDPETARRMGDAIRDMAAEMPVAHRELSNIAAAAGRLGITGVDNIQEFTRVTAEMAVATDLSANEAADAFARLTQLLDFPVEDVRRLGDVINELSNTAATSSSEITDSLLRSGAALNQLGLSTEEITALAASLNEVSESSERAGTRLRRVAQDIATAGKKDVGALSEALGISTAEFERLRKEAPLELMRMMAAQLAEGGDEARALGRNLTAVSQQALAALGQNLDGLTRNLETANQQMREGGSLTEEFEAANSTFNAELQRTKNQLRNVGIEIGERLLPYASDLLSEVGDAIEKFAAWNRETDGLAGTLALVAGLVVGVGAVLTALVGGPITAAIGIVAALAAAWATNWAGIRDTVTQYVSDVQEIVTEVFGTVLGEQFDKAAEYLADFEVNWGALWDFITERVQVGLAVIVAGITQIIDTIVTVVGSVINVIRSAIEAGQALKEGDLKGATKALAAGGQRQKELVEGYSQRTVERGQRLANTVRDVKAGQTTLDDVFAPTVATSSLAADSTQQDQRVVLELKDDMLEARAEGAAENVVVRQVKTTGYTTTTTGGEPYR